MRSHASTTRKETSSRRLLQRKPTLRIAEKNDAYEQEAERTADAVIYGTPRINRSLSKIKIASSLQREQGAKPKSEEEKYKEAAVKLGEAFLQTELGKEIKEKAEQLGEAFLATLPGKVITGTAITGALTALAATHKELPIGVPEIPLNAIKPGLKLKITYEGPVDKPTKVMASFSIPLGPPTRTKKPAMSKSERFRADTARMAMEQHQFRESMKTPEQRAEDQRLLDAWILSRMPVPGQPQSFGVAGFNLGKASGLRPAPLAPYGPEFKLTGEQPKTEEPKKKKEEKTIQRKSNGVTHDGSTPAIVNEVLQSPGQPLERITRSFMESRFGYDLSHVRIHTDNMAGQSAKAIHASAYTAGNNIVFANGHYSPETQRGRHLLAHELTHVMQQEGRSSTQLDTPTVQRKEKIAEQVLSPADALKETLKGDDDSVRSLTKAPQWKKVQLTPEDVAILLCNLLEGVVLDDDEIAGLAVLNKSLTLGIFDNSLVKLGQKGRFKELLDDYHGSEYQDLLDLLSKNISQLTVKALYLDAFIAMFWVQEHEERAIVILLERTNVNDQFNLLTVRDRQNKLRDAIDTDPLSIRYEKIAGKTNELQQVDLSAQLQKLFTVQSKSKESAKKRTPDEIKRLLIATATDLAAELNDYRNELTKALTAPKPDADAIAKINKEFEQRLQFLVKRKQREFHFELKYGVELNRFLTDARARSWTLTDLEDINKILAQIPPEILQANPAFRSILLASRGPKDPLGQAPWSGKSIILFGSFSLRTTVHELGHVISFDDGKRLQHAFNEAFKWQELTPAILIGLIPNKKDREELIKKMDEDRKEEREAKSNRHAYGNHFYRYNRYGGKDSYLRHPKNACFVSDYAATDPYDDFAEAFEEYLINPLSLHTACPKKYEFMRQKVFVGYFFGKQIPRTLSDFDKDMAAKLKGVALPGNLKLQFQNLYLSKLRAALKKQLTTTGKDLENKSLTDKPSKGMKRIPLTGKEAQQAAKPYYQNMTDLFGLLMPAVKPWQTFSNKVSQFKASAPKKYESSASIIGFRLSKEFQEDLLVLMQPHATRFIAGKSGGLEKWPQQLEGLVNTYQQAIKVAPSYLPVYDTFMDLELKIEASQIFGTTEKEEIGPTAWYILRQVPRKHPSRQEIKKYIIKRREELVSRIILMQKDIIREIRAGIPYKKSKLPTLRSLLKTYKRDIRYFIKQKSLRLKRKATRTAWNKTDGLPLTAQVLDSPGLPLPLDVRADMEMRFGHDFSRVRIHTDSRAAQSAQMISALAFTSGKHIVFAQGQYSPLESIGQRLLAHELTHVIQQGGATPSGPDNSNGDSQQLAFQRDTETEPPADGPAITQELMKLPVLNEAGQRTNDAPPFTEKNNTELDTPLLNALRTQANTKESTRGLVPANHPTEREAERIAARIIIDTKPLQTRSIAERIISHNSLSLNDKPRAQVARRTDIAFIMGSDKPKKRNKFYREASQYFKTNLAGVKLVNSPDVRNLSAVFTYLEKQKQPIGILYLISHAADDGTLSFPLQTGDKDKKVDYLELRSALKTSPELFNLPKNIIDQNTIIRIKGCRLGQSERMLATIGKAFGAGKVVAPTHRQYYGTTSTTTGKRGSRKTEKQSFEGFKTYFVEQPGSVTLDRNDQIKTFTSKYSHLTRSDWEKLIPKRGSRIKKKVEKRIPFSFSTPSPLTNTQALKFARKTLVKEGFNPTKVVNRSETSKPIKLPFREGTNIVVKGKFIQYTFENKKGNTAWQTYHVPTDDKAIIEAIKADESVPDAYEWNMLKTRRGNRITYKVEGVRTVYSLDRYIVSKLGTETVTKRLYIPPDKPGKFFGEYVATSTKAEEH